MKASEKLLEAFREFRPHITGHNTAMNLFFEALGEVEKMETEVEQKTCDCTRKERCDGIYFSCMECGRLHSL